MLKIFYVAVYDEYNYATKKWSRKRDIYTRIDSVILFKTYLMDRKCCIFRHIEELIVRTYSTGFVEVI